MTSLTSSCHHPQPWLSIFIHGMMKKLNRGDMVYKYAFCEYKCSVAATNMTLDIVMYNLRYHPWVKYSLVYESETHRNVHSGLSVEICQEKQWIQCPSDDLWKDKQNIWWLHSKGRHDKDKVKMMSTHQWYTLSGPWNSGRKQLGCEGTSDSVYGMPYSHTSHWK